MWNTMTAMDRFEELLVALDGAGLWCDVAEAEKRSLIAALVAGDDVTWRAGAAGRADGEDLADGEVEIWLGKLADPLSDCGVDLRVETVVGPFDPASTGYSVRVNGTTIRLYTFAEGEPGVPATADPWMDCTIQPAAEVNRLLETSGSARRMAIFWPGGNEGFSVLGDQGVLRRVGGATAEESCECVIP